MERVSLDVPCFLATRCLTYSVSFYISYLLVPTYPCRGHPVHGDLLSRPREKRWWRMTDCREKAHFHVPHSTRAQRDHSLLGNRALLTDQMRPLIGALQLGGSRQERVSMWVGGDANQGRGENWLAWLSIIRFATGRVQASRLYHLEQWKHGPDLDISLVFYKGPII